MAELDLTTIAAASIATPSAGVGAVYVDLTTKRLASKNDAGTVSDYADLTSTQTLAGKTLTTPVIGAATGTSVILTGAITTSSATAAGIGYATGSGGAVTQLTSRVTGVTLSKLNGAITLVSAAGSATYQTFTVTNTSVAATDNIIIQQKSGTDLYEIHVTNIASGSFKVTFATTGDTTVESPVFVFTVLKGVIA